MRDGKGTIHSDQSNALKGLAAGLIGGLVASWTMNRFQDVWSALAHQLSSAAQPSERGPKQGNSQRAPQANSGGEEEQDDTTVKAASAISEAIFNHRLTKSEKKIGGAAVHYSLGTSVGGLYGAVAELAPEVTVGAGLPFGAAFWLVVDETAVPLLGLAKPPTEYPVSTHVYALASHLVYGLTAELARRTVRNVL